MNHCRQRLTSAAELDPPSYQGTLWWPRSWSVPGEITVKKHLVQWMSCHIVAVLTFATLSSCASIFLQFLSIIKNDSGTDKTCQDALQENTILNCVIKNKKKTSATFTSQLKLSDFNPTRKYKKGRDAWFLHNQPFWIRKHPQLKRSTRQGRNRGLAWLKRKIVPEPPIRYWLP